MSSAHELVQSCTSIFTLPEIYFRVRGVVDDPSSTMGDLADALKLDPAISARVLRIVNSPLYGLPKQIDTITRAVSLLGMQAINDLVTATTVGRTFSGMTIQLMDGPKFWRKSVLCALLSGKIANPAASTTASVSSSKVCCATLAISSSTKLFRNGLNRRLSKQTTSTALSPK
ncbi:MAG: HDOD domain-containing protein [Nitrospiraceae bacterium]|nr:HDOD domain-containing protein [Nitrospiraceae bacterium]